MKCLKRTPYAQSLDQPVYNVGFTRMAEACLSAERLAQVVGLGAPPDQQGEILALGRRRPLALYRIPQDAGGMMTIIIAINIRILTTVVTTTTTHILMTLTITIPIVATRVISMRAQAFPGSTTSTTTATGRI